MATQTELLNDALGQVGAARITAIDDGSTNANHCQTFYPALRDGLLRGHFWNFALIWVELAQDAVPPTVGYAYSYELSPDFLRIKEYGGANPIVPSTLVTYTDRRLYLTYKIEGTKLRTNDGQAFIQYVSRVTNPDTWDALFYQAVSTLLAAKLSMAIRKEPKLSMALQEQGLSLLSTAMAVDGQEGSVEPQVVDDLIWGR